MLSQEDNQGRDGIPLVAVQRAVTDFVRACGEWGIIFNNSRPKIQHVGNTLEVSRAIVDVAKRAGYNPSAKPQFVLTMVRRAVAPVLRSSRLTESYFI